jgi:uncharacterized protein YgiB involved in biofilm formation
MKRSKSIRLVLLGAVSMTLGACGDDEPAGPAFFANDAECRRTLSADECTRAAQEAQALHARHAPRFSSREACETQFGAENCQAGTIEAPPGDQKPAQGSTAPATNQARWPIFMPIYHGFMANGAGSTLAAQPVYRDRTGAALTATPLGTQTVGRFSGPGSSGFVASASRGGFGATAGSRGSSS